MTDYLTDQTANDEPRGSSPKHAGGAQAQASQAKDAAADVASSGKQAAADVAATGKQAAADTLDQTKQQAGDLLGKTRDQVNEQVEVQKSSTVQTLRALGDQLASMTEHTDQDGTAVDVAARLRDRARSAADWLDHRDPNQVLDEVRQFGSERPGAFLFGAAVAGIVAGRLTRGVVDVHRKDSDTSTGAAASGRPAPGRHEEPNGPLISGTSR